MRALLSREPDGPESLLLGTLPDPVPDDGELILKVEACGVNFPDSLIIADKYQYKPQRPFAPGAEVAGTVVGVGKGVERFAPGDRVMAMCGWGEWRKRSRFRSMPAAECPPPCPLRKGQRS